MGLNPDFSSEDYRFEDSKKSEAVCSLFIMLKVELKFKGRETRRRREQHQSTDVDKAGRHTANNLVGGPEVVGRESDRPEREISRQPRI